MAQTYPTPPNLFKERLRRGDRLIGLWSVLGDGYSAELLAGCGYDWLLIDAEHGPNDLRSVLAQLQGISAAAPMLGDRAAAVSQAVVRLPVADRTLVKQFLEIGARNLLIPMVETGEEAAEMVAAVHYPPDGTRGVGSGLGRSSRWGRFSDYPGAADHQICLILQVENLRGVENVEAIAATPGVDGILFGAADLAASMGHLLDKDHPDVHRTLAEAAEKVRALGVRTGIMLTEVEPTLRWLDEGMTFAGVGVDTALLTKAADALLATFRGDESAHRPSAY